MIYNIICLYLQNTIKEAYSGYTQSKKKVENPIQQLFIRGATEEAIGR
jgi:hypothetical protein